jgi:hypothetical protein
MDKNTKSSVAILGSFLALVPLLSAALYLLGLSYHEGYLEIYGLNSSQFPIASDKALSTGFLTFSIESFPFRIYSISIAFLILLRLSFFQDFLGYFQNEFREKNLNKISRTKINFNNGWSFLILLMRLFGMLFILVVIAVTAYKSGKAQANFEQSNVTSTNTTISNIIYKREDNSKLPFEPIGNASLVICNSNSCAYWVKSETRILQTDRIEKISIIPMKALPKAEISWLTSVLQYLK